MSEQDQNSAEDRQDFEEKEIREEESGNISAESEPQPVEEVPSVTGNENQPTVGEDTTPTSHEEVHPVEDNSEPASVDSGTGESVPPDSSLNGLEEIVAPEESGENEELPIREEVVDDLAHILEAIIFASDEPLSVATIKSALDAAHTFGRVNPDMITARINALNQKYEADGNGFYIVEIANGYQYATRKEMAQWVSNLFKERAKRKLSNSALETLAIIAYKQPITKPEIESIRGVNVDYVLHSLLEKEIVTVVGRAETVGRPLLYGTTQKFLKIFALKNLEDLPKLREIEEIIKEIRSRGAEESIQLEITALGESSEPARDSESKPEIRSDNGAE